MKVLVGVCGFGLGHSHRQSIVVRSLHERGHRVAVFCAGQVLEHFRRLVPSDVPCHEVAAPWIPANRRGIDWTEVARRNETTIARRAYLEQRAFDWVEPVLGGPPELCLSDYEPSTASYAYLHDHPLVTLDQQSKFLGYLTQDVGTYGRSEERARLSHFFPYAEARLAVSFFAVREPADPEYRVEIFSTPVGSRLAGLVGPSEKIPVGDPSCVLVYFSPYSAATQDLTEVLGILACLRTYRFRVYDALGRAPAVPLPSNVELKPLSEDEFLRDLLGASSVVSTAGHTLLSECAFLRRPVYVVPLDTYDQHYCAREVERMGIGVQAERLDADSLAGFLARNTALARSYAGHESVTVTRELAPTILDRLQAAGRGKKPRATLQATRRAAAPTAPAAPTTPAAPTAPTAPAAPAAPTGDRLFLPDLEALVRPAQDLGAVDYQVAVLKPTLRCSCHCQACHARAKSFWNGEGREMSVAEWLPILDELAEMGFSSVVLSGGEPLLYPEITLLVAAAHERGLRTVLNTNGVAFTRQMRDELIEAGLCGINFSLDSPWPSIHDSLRRRAGAWRACVRGLRLAKETAVYLWTSIRTILTEKNYLDLPLMLARAARVGATSLKLSYLEWGSPGDGLLPSPESLRRLREYVVPACRALLPELGLSPVRQGELARILDDLLYPARIASDESFASGIYWDDAAMSRHCRLPQSLVIIQGDRSVLPCNAAEYQRESLPFRAGDAPLRELLLGFWMQKFRVERRPHCKRCPMPLHLTLPLHGRA